MTVTELRARRHRLTALFLDGGDQPVLIDTETAMAQGIAVGDCLDAQQLAELQELSDRNRAYEKALYLLDYRAHARAELITKISREYPREAAEQAVERVAALGLVNDAAFARDLARELIEQKKYGANRVRQELARRGIDRETIDAVLSERTDDPVAQIVQILQKKYAPLPADRKALSKIIAAMMRRGYAYDQVRQALRQTADLEIEDESE